jgi:serine/threonine protein kinase
MKKSSSKADDLSLTFKTIPTCVFDDFNADVDPGLARPRTPKSFLDRNAHLLIRRCMMDHSVGRSPAPLDYALKDKIGEGGSGLVFAACQKTLDREVAIKVIRPEIAQDPAVKALFLSEAALTGDLDHPNIVPIYDLGMDQHSCFFYAMKKIKGVPWKKVISEKTEAENIEILLRVCDAIAFAHDKGVVHRDLKPQNIMLGNYGEVFVMDWGIAVSPSGSGKAEILTPESTQAGTPVYMAPEMAEAKASRVNHLSDIYLLGGLLYEIQTGLTPHAAGNLKECLKKVIDNIIQPTNKSSELIDIALRAMSTQPSQRYQSVTEFSRAIRDYQSHAQSIVLCKSAAETHARARKSNSYQDYLMALFSYENALLMWPGNSQASAAKAEVSLDYAGAAFENKDYDLAISLLDAGNETHKALLDKVTAAREARRSYQKHMKWLKFGSLALALVTLVTVSIALVVVKIAQTQALQEYYHSAIALASRKVSDQLYGQAQILLNKLPENLRGWEWGRLTRLCHLDVATFQGHDQPLVAVAFSPDERFIATADRGGTIKIWTVSSAREIDTFSDSSVFGKIVDIRFSADGRQILARIADGLMLSWNMDSGAVTRAHTRPKTVMPICSILRIRPISSSERWKIRP